MYRWGFMKEKKFVRRVFVYLLHFANKRKKLQNALSRLHIIRDCWKNNKAVSKKN